jgi:hypothetical protein
MLPHDVAGIGIASGRSGTMSERIITDSRGQRWDVVQRSDSEAVFRHQTGTELTGRLDDRLDNMSTEQLLDALDAARRREGLDDVGHGGLDVAFDPEGYETGPG